jgi:hypothetical protein
MTKALKTGKRWTIAAALAVAVLIPGVVPDGPGDAAAAAKTVRGAPKTAARTLPRPDLRAVFFETRDDRSPIRLSAGHRSRGLMLSAAVTPPKAGKPAAPSPSTVPVADGRPVFDNPEAALKAFRDVLSNRDPGGLRILLGPRSAEVVPVDDAPAKALMDALGGRYGIDLALIPEGDTRFELRGSGPGRIFPVPLVSRGAGWLFDTETGLDEAADRLIGGNEMAAVETMRAFVEAQRVYASMDRDEDEVLEYAQRLACAPRKRDGLSWPSPFDEEQSPLPAAAARAEVTGGAVPAEIYESAPVPDRGYLFRVLKRQGPAPPGGRYGYVINGHMIGGFALVGWPAVWGETGVMTFVVNQGGKVWRKNLGEKTSSVVGKLVEYNPDASWEVVED